MPRAGKEFVPVGWVDGSTEFQAAQTVKVRVGEHNRRLRFAGLGSLPGNVCLCIGNHYQANRSRLLQLLPSLSRRLVERSDRPGNRIRSAADGHCDLAVQVKPGELVKSTFPHCETITDKYRRCVHRAAIDSPDVDGCFLADVHRNAFLVAHQLPARLRGIGLSYMERDVLQVSCGAGRLQSRLLELILDILCSKIEPMTASLATFQRVTGQVLNVGPPTL